MANPFIDSARTILADLEGGFAAQLAESARQTSIASGVDLTIEEALALALVAKHIASTDGLSAAESSGMTALLDFYGVPAAAQAALHQVDLAGANDEHIRELVPTDSAKARHLVSGVAYIAARDGLSDDELARIAAIGTKVGLSLAMIDALVAESEAAVLASIRGDRALLGKLDRLRSALFRI